MMCCTFLGGFKYRFQGYDGELINDWRSCGAVCFPKDAGDFRSLQRWRIICLAHALFRWYEIFIYKQLEKFVPSLPDCIVGYQPGSQCLDIVCFLNDMLAKAYAWKLPGAFISMDIGSAFDNIRPDVAARTPALAGSAGGTGLCIGSRTHRARSTPIVGLAFCRAPPVPYGAKELDKDDRGHPNKWHELVAAALGPLQSGKARIESAFHGT